MAKTYLDSTKYIVYAHIEVGGQVTQNDIVGAIFGQTEGLLGPELDIRTLVNNGKLGRIEVVANVKGNRTFGSIKIPSGLNAIETALIAASIEAVERVGPYAAKVNIDRIEDTRKEKRIKIVEKAKQYYRQLINTELPDTKELLAELISLAAEDQIIEYGPERLPAVKGFDTYDEIILVEGRADVINLVKADIYNVVSIGGANKVPASIVELSKKKTVTVFLDGDSGASMILKNLISAGVEIDYIAKAPEGKEVEELTRKEIIKALRNKVEFHPPEEQQTQEEKAPQISDEEIKQKVQEMVGTNTTKIITKKGTKEIASRYVLKELEKIDNIEEFYGDVILTPRLLSLLLQKQAKVIGVNKIGAIPQLPKHVKIVAIS
ncbi:MAG: DNA primase [Candidatus Micrarchaeota archaeon]|nr:DNA primase [Candidatus Micrarchaeota archaeon]